MKADFKTYVVGRLLAGVIGIAVLYIFSDIAGFKASVVAILWTPLSWVISYTWSKDGRRKEKHKRDSE